MAFLIDQIKEQKILEMEVNLEDFLQQNSISEKAIIFGMVFDKEVFTEEKEVREYLKDKYFYEPAIADNGDSFVASVLSDAQVDSQTVVEIELRRGVTAMAADLLPAMTFSDIEFNDKDEVNLSSKFDTINLSEGLPHIIQIARVAEGEHPSYGKLNIIQSHLESMELNFKSKVQGVDLAINEDHKKNEAFGWLKDVFLSFDKQTLYGQVVWNTKGTTALSEKEYRYFSPEFRFNYTHPLTGAEHGPTLLGGALTNYPFLKMEAITELNNKNHSQGDDTVSTETINLSEHNKIIVELNGKVSEVQGKLDAVEANNVELNAKIETLETEKAEIEKAKLNEKLFNDGHINKAQLVALNEGKGMLEVLALNTVMNTEAKGVDTKETVTVELNAKEKEMAAALDLSDEEFIKFNK